MITISVADAKVRFSELISRAASGERFIIRCRERDVAVLISPGDLERLERAALTVRRLALALGQNETLLQKVARREAHPAMTAFGLWREEHDLADLAEGIAAGRAEATACPGQGDPPDNS